MESHAYRVQDVPGFLNWLRSTKEKPAAPAAELPAPATEAPAATAEVHAAAATEGQNGAPVEPVGSGAAGVAA